MFDIERFLRDYSVRYDLRREGVITVNCSDIYHTCVSSKGSRTLTGAFLYNGNSVSYYCFRCGTHKLSEVIGILSGEDGDALHEIFSKYDSNYDHFKKKETTHAVEVVLPSGDLTPDYYYYEYLKNRGFDPETLSDSFNLRFTKHYLDIKNSEIMSPKVLVDRIVIPIYRNGILISWTSRSINKDAIRYISCPKDKEVYNHKSTLFNLDNCKGENVAIVEGPFDAMKGGSSFCATFGIEFCTEQVYSIIEKKFKKAYIMFDSERKAQNKAKDMASILSSFMEAYVVDLELGERDVGAMNTDEIIELKKELKLI